MKFLDLNKKIYQIKIRIEVIFMIIADINLERYSIIFKFIVAFNAFVIIKITLVLNLCYFLNFTINVTIIIPMILIT